ncbi:hypothetical protein R6Q57_011474 [Mikania cordata]
MVSEPTQSGGPRSGDLEGASHDLREHWPLRRVDCYGSNHCKEFWDLKDQVKGREMNLSDVVAIGRLVGRRQTGESIAVATTKLKEDDGRRAALRMVDRQLTKGNFKLALSLVKQLQRQPSPGGLCGFAAARQVPRRVSSIEQLHLSVAESSAFQSLLDAILDSIKCSLQASPLEESSVTNEDNDLYLEDDMVKHMQVLQHEAGHFLVGYLLGVLPKQYKVSCMEDKITDANVKFVGFEFLTELEDVVLSNKSLDIVKSSHRALSRFACVIVGGLVAEHLAFGHSKGHHGDMDKVKVGKHHNT